MKVLKEDAERKAVRLLEPAVVGPSVIEAHPVDVECGLHSHPEGEPDFGIFQEKILIAAPEEERVVVSPFDSHAETFRVVARMKRVEGDVHPVSLVECDRNTDADPEQD